MKYWLFKSEPNTWSWTDQKRVGIEPWDGVRNYQASNNMKAMAIGDQAFFYHSVNERKIVGIVEVVKAYYPDHTDEKGRFGMVDIKALHDVEYQMTLSDIKNDPRLTHLPLVKQSRLSVSPIDADAWRIMYDRVMTK